MNIKELFERHPTPWTMKVAINVEQARRTGIAPSTNIPYIADANGKRICTICNSLLFQAICILVNQQPLVERLRQTTKKLQEEIDQISCSELVVRAVQREDGVSIYELYPDLSKAMDESIAALAALQPQPEPQPIKTEVQQLEDDCRRIHWLADEIREMPVIREVRTGGSFHNGLEVIDCPDCNGKGVYLKHINAGTHRVVKCERCIGTGKVPKKKETADAK